MANNPSDAKPAELPITGGERRGRNLDVLAIVALFWVLLPLDPNWPYATLIHDPWIYLGYGIDPWGMLGKFPHLYFSSRPAIIIPVAVAHAILPALAANLLLRFVLFEFSLLCVYSLLSRGIGRRTALLTALILGTHYYFLDAIARDYSDGFGIAYLLAAIWGVSWAEGSWRGILAMSVSGACTMALIAVNLTFVILTPIPLVFYAATLARSRGVRGVAIDLAAFGVGALAVFAAFCLFFQAATGDYWFLGPSIGFARMASSSTSPLLVNGRSVFKFAGAEWVGAAGWLALPIAVATVSTLVLLHRLFRRSVTPSKLSLVWPPLYLAQFLGFLAFNCLSPTSILLQAWFYASMLIPLMILALGTLLGPIIESLSKRDFSLCLALAALVFLGQTAIPTTYTFPHNDAIPPLLAALTPAILALVAVTEGRGKALTLAAMVLLAVSVYFSRSTFSEERSVPIFRQPHTSETYRQKPGDRHLRPYVQRIHQYDKYRAEAYLSIVEALRYIETHDENDDVLFWFDMFDPHSMLYDNLACCRNWSISILNFSLPAITEARTWNNEVVKSGRLIAITSVKPDADGIACQALARLGFDSKVLGRRTIEHGNIKFTVILIRIEQISPQAENDPVHYESGKEHKVSTEQTVHHDRSPRLRAEVEEPPTVNLGGSTHDSERDAIDREPLKEDKPGLRAMRADRSSRPGRRGLHGRSDTPGHTLATSSGS